MIKANVHTLFYENSLSVINKSLKSEIHCCDVCVAYNKYPEASTAVCTGRKFGFNDENSVTENLFSRLHVYII
jgi:hypothetical protein